MVGIDEVGRGCWAGPLLVVAARAKSELPKGLMDSKLMSKKQREEILNKLSICCEFGEGWVTAPEIDKYGLAQAMKIGVGRALGNIGAQANEKIILDGNNNYASAKYTQVKTLVKADSLVPIVSAASVYAKVTRDNFMSKISSDYPLYGFEKHVGYGTKNHMIALANHGVIKNVHRLSFAPIAKFAGGLI